MSRRGRGSGAWWPAALLAALALVLGAACSGSDPESAQDPPAGEVSSNGAGSDGSATVGAGASAAERADPEDADPGDVDPEGGDADDGEPEWFTPLEERVYPLSAFIGELAAELFPGSQRFDSDPMAVREQMTLECMTGQGFRYEVMDWAAISAEADAAMPDLAAEDEMAAGGYGFADSLGAPLVFESSYVDPNLAIKAGLSSGELEAWERQYFECVHEAQDEYFESTVIYQALAEDMDALQERIDTDPRVVEAQAGWSACMAEQGHDYLNRDAIWDYLSPIADRLQARLRALSGPEHDDEAYRDAAYLADVDALREIEVEIAVADIACRKRLDQVVYEVTVEHEQRFLDENQDRLALLREEIPTMTLGGNLTVGS